MLPCPVHGPIWAKPRWTLVIQHCSCACLASPRTPLGDTLTLSGDGKDIWLALNRTMHRNGGHRGLSVTTFSCQMKAANPSMNVLYFHVCAQACLHSLLALTSRAHFKANIHEGLLFFFFSLRHTCIRTLLSVRSFCKASPCTDKQKISSDRYFSYCLLLLAALALMTGFDLQKKNAPTLPLMLPLVCCYHLPVRPLNKAPRVRQCIFTARLRRAFWVET